MTKPLLDREFILSRLKATEGFEKVRFIILYGSFAEGRAIEDSDIDLAIYYDGTTEERSLFRFHALISLDSALYDLHIFQDIPLYIRVQVLRGEIVYCPLLRFLYDVAGDTIREYDDFKHRLWDYTGEKVIS